ncbi:MULTISPECIES: terpene synthase family protein [unclassified Aureispira]|uniref:terpene synthase family protein n=1 Tax=unclassified Aureispira TaxID=2649989 RepID=UPI000697048F|nr:MULTISPECIES: terpene synthase family protein [unclassified Aureispira]WMX12889.1 terpene synthase family protein [Aureispira sp. CCB-E]
MKERNQEANEGNKPNVSQIANDFQDNLSACPVSPFNSKQLTISTLEIHYHEAIQDILKATSKLTKELDIQLEEVYSAHTSMTAFLYPNSGRYRLVIANVLYDFLYYIDDLFGEDIEIGEDDERPSLMAMMQIWKTGKIQDGFLDAIKNPKIKNIYNALLWIRTKLFQSSEPAFFKKLSGLLFEHLKDQLEPKDFSTVDEYILLRRRFGGMYPVAFLVEYCNNRYLAAGTLEKVPSLQKAIDACADIGGLSNDIFSYPKESHSKFNLVNSYLVAHPEMTLKEAVQNSIDLVNDCHFEFDQAIEQLQTEVKVLSEEQQITVLKFAEGLKDILSASYHWQFVTQRFRHDNHILEDLKHESTYTFNSKVKNLIPLIKKHA